MIRTDIIIRGLGILLVALALMTWAKVDADESSARQENAPASLSEVEASIQALKDERHDLVSEVLEINPALRELERAKRKHEKGLEAMDKELAYISNRIQYLRTKAPDQAPPEGLVQAYDRVAKARVGVEDERFGVAKELQALMARKTDIGNRLRILDQEMEDLKKQRRALGG